MASSFAFGSYVPAKSVIHALNAQVKVILACAFSMGILFVDTWLGLLAALVAACVMYGIARVPVRNALRGLLPIAFILAFTVLVHAFSFDLAAAGKDGAAYALWPGAQPPFAGGDWQILLAGSFGFTCPGLLAGVFIAMRIALLVSACALLTFTTREAQLVDALRGFLIPLRAVRVPADHIAMIVSLALRFVPLVALEAYNVRDAQRARGADFDAGSLSARMRAWVPVLIPLFTRLFKHADSLGEALEARCYGAAARPRGCPTRWRACDGVVCACGLVFVVTLAVLL